MLADDEGPLQSAKLWTVGPTTLDDVELMPCPQKESVLERDGRMSQGPSAMGHTSSVMYPISYYGAFTGWILGGQRKKSPGSTGNHADFLQGGRRSGDFLVAANGEMTRQHSSTALRPQRP